MFLRVDSVRPLEGYTSGCSSNDGVVKDVRPCREVHGAVFEPLREMPCFRRVAVIPRRMMPPSRVSRSPRSFLELRRRRDPYNVFLTDCWRERFGLRDAPRPQPRPVAVESTGLSEGTPDHG